MVWALAFCILLVWGKNIPNSIYHSLSNSLACFPSYRNISWNSSMTTIHYLQWTFSFHFSLKCWVVSLIHDVSLPSVKPTLAWLSHPFSFCLFLVSLSHCAPSFLLSVGISHRLALCAHAPICLEDLSSSRTYFSLHEDDSWSPISRLTLSLLTWGSSMELLDRKHKHSMIKSKFIFSTLKWFSFLFSLYLLGLFPHIQSHRSSRSSKILSKVIFPALPLYSIIFGSTQHVSNNLNIAFFSFYSN